MNKGLNKFGKKGRNSACKESHQIHNHIVFKPMDLNSLTPDERKKAMESLMLLTEKRNGNAKGRTCVNGKPQRSCMSKDEASTLTANTEYMLSNAAT